MKIVILLIFVYAFVFGNSLTYFEKGWSLVSISSSLENMDDFNNSNVEIVWGFDATNQLWQGYSPDKTLAQKMSDANISTLNSLHSYQAFWILSRKPWSLELKSETPAQVDNSTITLKKGWNLVSIPQQVIVPSDFFGDAVVWKYSESDNWSVNDDSLNFPSIGDIKSSEGLWVKSGEDTEINLGERLSKLQTFTSKADMIEYIREMIKANRYSYGYPMFETMNGLEVVSPIATDETSADSTVDATTTNLQESGVDESDILKHDGANVYSVDKMNSRIFITSFENLALKNYEPINTIPTQGKSVTAMYLVNSRLILISRENVDDKQIYEADAVSPYYSYTQNILIDIYNVSDINKIVEVSSYKIDGSYSESRVVDSRLFLISAFYPEVSYDYPKVYIDTICNSLDRDTIYSVCSASSSDGKVVEESTCSHGKDYELWNANNCYSYNYDEKGAYSYDYDNPIILSEKLIPFIEIKDRSLSLLSPSKFYAPIKLNQSTNITTLSSFEIEEGRYTESVSFIGNTHTYYASKTSLYLLSKEYPIYYDYSNYKEQEMIYKFSIGENLDYISRGFVDGRALNQFSMSEKDEYLRIATTSGFSWMSNETDNKVFTLKSEGDMLNIEGTLNGLGKSGETIQAVRFMGNRGFVVTFKQTDPLYTLDLSDPKNPQKVGELSIPGFSRYLHIVDENRVLSIGRDADEESGQTLGLQLQLFDISDFANPMLAAKVQVGGSSTYSSAEYNHKALAYRPSDMMFGLPYTNYDSQNSSENFGIYKINDMQIQEIDTLSKISNSYRWAGDSRGLIFDLNSSTYGAFIEGSDILSDKIKEGE